MKHIELKNITMYYRTKMGSSILSVIKELLNSANTVDLTCVTVFNETLVIAKPGDAEADILSAWTFKFNASRCQH